MSKIVMLQLTNRLWHLSKSALFNGEMSMKNPIKFKLIALLVLISAAAFSASAQADVSRRMTAITFPLDDTVLVQFRGTTRFPRMKGNATIKRTSRKGTEIKLAVDNMPRPFDLGTGYTTYVAWAVSPDGQFDNLGEIKRSTLGFIDSKLTGTTEFQTFAIVVTAEPHFRVARPSQMIMLENLFPVATDGKRIPTSQIEAYFGNSSDYFRDPRTPEIAETDFAKILPIILQAKQAVALARFAGAERDAAPEFAEAQTLLQNAQNAFDAGRDKDYVDITARNAVTAAVKAETLALERKAARDKRNEKTRSDAEIRLAENKYADAQGEIADLKSELAREVRNRELAERDVQNYANQVRDLRDENGRLRDDNTALRIENENAKAKIAAAEEEKKAIQQRSERELNAAQIRAKEGDLINSLKAFGTVTKNERGIILTLPETLWTNTRSGTLTNQADGKLASLGEILSNNSAYNVSVESHTDNSGNPEAIQTLTDKRSYAVADKLTSLGVPEGRIVAKGFGASLPVAPNTTAANRAKNRRLHVVLILNTQ